MANALGRVQPIQGDFPVDADVPLLAEENEALALTTTDTTNPTDWTYSANAEDNGIAGELDLEPGLTYNGPSGMLVRVVVNNLDMNLGIIAPEDTDGFYAALFINSVLSAEFDERVVIEQDAEEVEEMNLDTSLLLNEGDVVHICFGSANEETGGLDVVEGGEWSIT